jgi:hypothetical protein
VFTKAKKLGLELASRAGIHIHMERERSGRDRQRQEMLDAE